MRTHVYTQAQIRLQFERTPVGCAAQIKGIKSGAAPPAVMEEKLVPKVTLLPASLHLTHLIFLCESSFLLLHLFPPPPMCRFLPLSSNTYFQNLFFCSGFPACFFFFVPVFHIIHILIFVLRLMQSFKNTFSFTHVQFPDPSSAFCSLMSCFVFCSLFPLPCRLCSVPHPPCFVS